MKPKELREYFRGLSYDERREFLRRADIDDLCALLDVQPEAKKKPELERCEIREFDDTFSYRLSDATYANLHHAVNKVGFAGYEYEDGTVWVTPWRIVVSPFVGEKDKLERAKYVLFRRNT